MIAHADLDPRSKLALTVAVVVGAIAAGDHGRLLALLGFVAVVVLAGRGYGLGDWLASLRPFLVILPVLLVLDTVFYAGGATILGTRIAGVAVGITTGGLAAATRIGLRLLVMAGIAAWFSGTTDAEAFEAGLLALGVPYRIAVLVSLSTRLVPTMRRRFALVAEAQRARGLSVEGGPLARARARMPMLVPFLATVLRYGYELGDALRARGFDREGPRTNYVTVRHDPVDYAVDLLAVVVVVLGLIPG